MCIYTLHIFSGPGDVREKRRLGRSDFNSRFDRNRFIFFFFDARSTFTPIVVVVCK